MSKYLHIFIILNVFFFYSNQISKSNTRSQECYIITKKLIRHWKALTLSFSLLLHFLHFFLTFSFSSFLYSQILAPPLLFSSFLFFLPSFLFFFVFFFSPTSPFIFILFYFGSICISFFPFWIPFSFLFLSFFIFFFYFILH